MKQQNQNEIQKLFDDYAESLSPQPQLASRAKERYLSMQVAQKPRRAVWAAAVCAVIVFVIAAAAVLPVLTGGGEPQVYAASQTAGQRVDADFAGEIVNLQAFEGSAYSIVSQKYYAFRLDGNVVYMAAQLGFSTDQGIVEVQFVAEKDGFVRLDWRTDYERYLKDNDGLRVVERRPENMPGEYVTNAYFKANGMRFYVYTQCNPSAAQFVQPILQIMC